MFAQTTDEFARFRVRAILCGHSGTPAGTPELFWAGILAHQLPSGSASAGILVYGQGILVLCGHSGTPAAYLVV